MCPCHQNDPEFTYALLAAAVVLVGISLMRKHWVKMGPALRIGSLFGMVLLVGLVGYAVMGSDSGPATVCTWDPDPIRPSATRPGITPEPAPATDPDGDGASERTFDSSHTRDAPATLSADRSERLTADPDHGLSVIAYYFHRTMRCHSCLTIEEFSKQAIEEKFLAELADGLLEYHSVNIDKQEHQHFENDYKLTVQSLVLVRIEDGQVVEWKNLEKVWDLFQDYGAFAEYVQREVSHFLDPDTSVSKSGMTSG